MSQPPSLLQRPSGWLVANLLAQIAFGLLAMTICLPSMQEWGSIFSAEQSQVQLTFSGFVMAYGGLQLVYGPLSDRHGRRAILLIGLTLGLAGSVLAACMTDIQGLVFARVLQGAGSAAGMVVGRSMVQDLFQGPQRTRVMAFIGMALGLCPPLATVIGGQLHVAFGWQANFWVMSGLALALWLAAWRGLPAKGPTAAPESHWLRAMVSAYTRLAKEPAFLSYVAILAMTTATFYTFLSGAPIVLGSYGVGPEGVGWYIMMAPLSYIVGNYTTSHFIHRLGEKKMMLAGQTITVMGLLLMLALGLMGWKTPLAFAMPMMLLGLGHGFLVPPTLAGSVGLIPALAGSAAAVAGLMQQLMGAVGGFSVGLVPHDGAVNLSCLMLGFTALAVLAHWRLHRPQRASATAAKPMGYRPWMGILYMCLAASFFPVMNGLAKWMSQSYTSEQVVWFRTVSHLLLVLMVLLPKYGVSILQTRRPWLQLGRSTLLMASTILFFTAIQFVSLAQAASISFTAPLIVVLLAGPMLGEKVRLSRIIGVIFGFAGVLVVIRPGSSVFHWASLLILGNACCYAVYQLLTRKVAGIDRPETSVVYSALLGSVLLSLAVPFFWTPLASLSDALILCSLGALGALGHYCVARAMTYAPANFVSPFNYWQMVGSVAVGYWLFDDLPDSYTWLGAGMIIVAGIYVGMKAEKATS